MLQISGRSVLVTGGQRGLGAAFTQALLTHGAARVYVTARKPAASSDHRIVPLALDVTRLESVDALVDSASDVSIVINNAGVTMSHAVLSSDIDEMKAVFDANVFGPIRVARAFAPVLARHEKSALVNVHSVLSWLAGSGAYGASKAALWSFTNSMRVELASQGTSVAGVHLGLADTDMSSGIDAPKVSPAFVAAAVVAGIETGGPEILVDDISRSVKSVLSGPVEDLVVTL